ncbi:MAG: Ubiquinone biosynthesis protein UbiA [Ferruginibacter sp.]|nr:Ubiquinone biosynthesis protein UbiA [Ferruginibacter sp.]
MKTIGAFLRLTRWPNLVFIGLTQALFYFSLFHSLLNQQSYPHGHRLFLLLVVASILIAAAGYIINDYFDLQIDAVNKPEKVVVDKEVKRRWAIMWHLVFSAVGILLSIFISYKTGSWVITIANICCVILLWFYSTTFKKRLLSGNIIIAALTAWVIIVMYFFSGADHKVWFADDHLYDARKLFKFTILYAGFAFIVSLVREALKDLEDIEGDARYHCRTMPIVWGVPAAKVFIAVWLIVCISSLAIVQLYAWKSGWRLIVGYNIITIIFPLCWILQKLYTAVSKEDYHTLSSAVKFVMLAGILSMAFFRFLN